MRLRRDENRRESVKSEPVSLILAVLFEGSNHGYGIARRVEERTDALFQIGEGALYPALRSLENEGFIVSEWQTQMSGPARKVYTITEAGRAEHARRLTEWERYKRTMDRILGVSGHVHPI